MEDLGVVEEIGVEGDGRSEELGVVEDRSSWG